VPQNIMIKIENDSFKFRYNTLAGGVGPIHLGLLRDAFFLVVWVLDPLGYIVVDLNEGFGVDLTSTLFESSLALLKVGCVVLGSDDGDEDDEGRYDTNEDNLDLMIRGV
jgi:hypothetical protein